MKGEHFQPLTRNPIPIPPVWLRAKIRFLLESNFSDKLQYKCVGYLFTEETCVSGTRYCIICGWLYLYLYLLHAPLSLCVSIPYYKYEIVMDPGEREVVASQNTPQPLPHPCTGSTATIQLPSTLRTLGIVGIHYFILNYCHKFT